MKHLCFYNTYILPYYIYLRETTTLNQVRHYINKGRRSEVTGKNNRQGSQDVANTRGSLQLRFLNLNFTDSGYHARELFLFLPVFPSLLFLLSFALMLVRSCFNVVPS